MNDANGRYAKIAFRADDGEVETLWAFDLGEGRFRLDSSSWFQYGVSFRDVILAQADANGQLLFSRVLEKSGHRTLRVLFESRVDASHPVLAGLVQLGCTFEGYFSKLFAVDVPPSVSLDPVVGFLTDSGVRWEHADPTYSELHATPSEP